MKRALDLILVLFTLPLWGSVALVIALILFCVQRRPILYASERAGQGGRPFQFLKFRTMREGEGSDAERLTRVGKVLRSTSLDELPQLLHVLSGKMSLVGPRPLPVRYLPRYTVEQARRHDVRPGITGWAQVNGRNNLTWDEKFRLDVWYVEHQSIALDAKILLMTVKQVLFRTGINNPNYDTMCEFKGGQI